MIWYKVAWINPLFARFNALWPNRNHAQDGTIGDTAHMSGTSGHNPDDTPGVSAERQDADTKPEVRAADVDTRGTDMERAVQDILRGPAAERDRLIYIIYNRRIWRKSNGWRQETYTGSDPHDTHAHFSGDPAADENGAPWTFGGEDDMEQTEPLNPANAEGNKVGDALNIATQVRTGLWLDETKTGYGAPKPASALGKLYAMLSLLNTAVTEVAAKVAAVEAAVANIQAGQVSQDVVNAAVLSAMQTPEVREIIFEEANRAEDE